MIPYIDIHTHGNTSLSDELIAVRSVRWGVDKPPLDGLYSAGIHPWDALLPQMQMLDSLPVHDPNMLAVGEVGLDYRPQFAPREAQLRLFEQQISVAEIYGKPLILHSVEATELMQALIRGVSVPVVLHGFARSVATARQWIKSGAYLSFGARLLHSQALAEALRSIPMDRIFFESDQWEGSVESIYSVAAAILDINEQKLREMVFSNFERVFINK